MKNVTNLVANGLYQIQIVGGSPEVIRSWNGTSFKIETQSDRDNGNLESFKGSEIEHELAKAKLFIDDMYENHGWIITMENVGVVEVSEYDVETDSFIHSIQK
mgnify:CR=1 FL=1